MSTGSPYQEPVTEQSVTQNNWNQHEFGLKPRNLAERLAANFIKAWSYISGWDSDAEIWRALNVDASGNLKTSNGTQSTNAPRITVVSLIPTFSNVLESNPARRSFSIFNDAVSSFTGQSAILIQYPNPAGNYYIYVPAGCVYVDDSWNGLVQCAVSGVSDNHSVTVVEYY